MITSLSGKVSLGYLGYRGDFSKNNYRDRLLMYQFEYQLAT